MVLPLILLAITGFQQTIALAQGLSSGTSSTNADSTLLMGWAYAELKQPEQAIGLYQTAYRQFRQLAYPMSSHYAQVSLMEEYLKLARWQQVIDLAQISQDGYLVNIYAARAYYELGQFSLARQQLQKSKVLRHQSNNGY